MTETRTTIFGRALCIAGASIGAVGLAGWLTGINSLLTVIPGQPPMMPNTAIGLLLLGSAAALPQAKQAGHVRISLSALLAIVALAIGLGTLAEYVLHLQINLDQFFIRSQAGPYPGRPSPPTAVSLALLATAILIVDSRFNTRARLSEWLILTAAIIAFTALLGQLFGVGPLYRFSHTPVIGVAVHTALSLLMISFGLLLERPDAGLMRVFMTSGPGGVLLRRLALPAVLTPVAFGLIAARFLQIPGVEDIDIIDFLFASLVVATTVASLFLLAITAARLDLAHDALEQSRARERDLIEQASDGIFIADLAGRYTAVNDAGCRMLGYSRDDILGKTIVDLILPEDVERLRNHKAQLLKGGADIGEWMLRHEDGSYRPMEVSAKILPDGRWQGFVRDIGERKRAEEALRLSETKFSGMVSISADAIISIDEAQRITLFNEGAEKIFGCSSAEMIGAPLDVLIPERFREIHARHIKSFMAGPDTARQMSARSGKVRGLRRNGEEFPADAAISKLSVGGKSILSVTLRDITESERLYQAAIHASQARDEVLGIVAHDLRNPLQIITTYSWSLRRLGPEPAREMAEQIGIAANRMNRLIQDLLDVTSMESGHLSLGPVRLTAREIVEDSLSTQMPLATSASVELRPLIAPDLPDIWADRHRILQVFENLIGNAIKFTKAGGRITLRAEASTGEVVFSVSDTGSGIAESDLPHVFDRFWQASHGAHRGAGLGLAIVKGIVEAHGGRIWVRSTAGQGATFFFTIPIAGPGTAPPQPDKRDQSAVPPVAVS